MSTSTASSTSTLTILSIFLNGSIRASSGGYVRVLAGTLTAARAGTSALRISEQRATCLLPESVSTGPTPNAEPHTGRASMDDQSGWRRDPTGRHQERYFRASGIPTDQVRDGGIESTDEDRVESAGTHKSGSQGHRTEDPTTIIDVAPPFGADDPPRRGRITLNGYSSPDTPPPQMSTLRRLHPLGKPRLLRVPRGLGRASARVGSRHDVFACGAPHRLVALRHPTAQ